MPYEGMANSMDGQNSVLSVVGPLATTPDALKLVMQALLTKRPWLHDPLVLEIPWRTASEVVVSDAIQRFSKPLSFGVIRDDGCCHPHPPIARAVDMVVKALESRGHKVIDWKPKPDHGKIAEITYKCWGFDGGVDCKKDFDLSGEPQAEQALIAYQDQANASDIMATNIEKREAQKDYMEYWNSTRHRTGTGEPVDAIISPLAPFPAARRKGYTYYGYSVWVNLLDYTSVVVPVTNVDKNIDKKNENFKAFDDVDQKTQDTYDPEIYDGAHVSIQLVGRRLQEEKMLALAKYVGGILHA
jgi:amidase